jgi:hypothetical protein
MLAHIASKSLSFSGFETWALKVCIEREHEDTSPYYYTPTAECGVGAGAFFLAN